MDILAFVCVYFRLRGSNIGINGTFVNLKWTQMLFIIIHGLLMVTLYMKYKHTGIVLRQMTTALHCLDEFWRRVKHRDLKKNKKEQQKIKEKLRSDGRCVFGVFFSFLVKKTIMK